MTKDNHGTATGDLLWVVAVVSALWILWFATGGTERPAATAGPFISPPVPIGAGEIYSPNSRPTRGVSPGTNVLGAGNGQSKPANPNQSPWSGLVKINAGNARYEIQPNREYIELSANYQLETPIIITGWLLTNGKNQLYGVSDSVMIPAAVKLFVAGNVSAAPIILESGGRVVVTTGGPPNTDRWPARVSFQINKCVGYLAEDVSQFRMTPSLPRACPSPRAETDLNRIDRDCYDFVSRLTSCHTPKFERDSEGYNLVDDRRLNLTSQCRTYVQNHFSYTGCVSWHAAEPDFYGKDWRVYLNHTGEFWAKDREVITLYDSQGKIVDRLAY